MIKYHNDRPAEAHFLDCRQPYHLMYVLGVYDRHDRCLYQAVVVVCADEAEQLSNLPNLLEMQRREWPGGNAYGWLDRSVFPLSERLRDAPTPDAVSGDVMS